MSAAFALTSDDEKRLAVIEATFAYTLVFSSAQVELLLQALSDAFDDAQQAMQQEPHGKDEIQPYADGFNGLMVKLLEAKSRKANRWRPAQALPVISRPPDDALTMRQFAAREGIKIGTVYWYAKHGRILGLFRMLRTKQWLVCAHGELVEAAANPRARNERAACAGASAVDFGTSPHGLAVGGRSGGLCGVQPPRRKADREDAPSLKAGVQRTAKPEAARPESPRPGRVSLGELSGNPWLAMLPEGMR